MKKIKVPTNFESRYLFLKEDFKSAYRNNGNNIELALTQVAILRELDKEHIRTILRDYLKTIK